MVGRLVAYSCDHGSRTHPEPLHHVVANAAASNSADSLIHQVPALHCHCWHIPVALHNLVSRWQEVADQHQNPHDFILSYAGHVASYGVGKYLTLVQGSKKREKISNVCAICSDTREVAISALQAQSVLRDRVRSIQVLYARLTSCCPCLCDRTTGAVQHQVDNECRSQHMHTRATPLAAMPCPCECATVTPTASCHTMNRQQTWLAHLTLQQQSSPCQLQS